MKSIDDFKSYMLLGGGVMAERLYKQLEIGDRKLIGVMDMLDEEQRTKKTFHDLEIHSPNYYEKQIKSGETALVVAIGALNVNLIIASYLDKYSMGEENLFVVNPYTALRFFCIDKELSAEARIPVTDKRYEAVKELFRDKVSMEIYRMLVNSRPYDTIEDAYEIMPYEGIKDMFYWSDDYWQSYEFDEVQKENKATIFDCGAYIGDSVSFLCQIIPQTDITYYAFEPNQDNVQQMKKNKELCKCCSRFEIIECGVGETDDVRVFKLPANQDKEGGRFLNDKNDTDAVKLEIRSLDGLDLDIKGQLYIKMDIEGSELAALKGAENLIKTFKPYLAICVHHGKNDLVEIPLYIKALMPDDYDFYLRGGYHTILWAIPKKDEKND